MYYEGFSQKPVLNPLGMPCIGYGFPLWEEALNILHGNSKLARSIKNSMPQEQENMELGMKRLLALPLTVTEKTGKALLVQSLLYYAEELSKKYAGFRHLVNQCGQGGGAVVYPQSSFAQYEGMIALQNPVFEEKPGKKAGASKKQKEKQYTKATQKQSMTFLQREHGTRLNGTERPLHPAFLQSFYSSSEAFAGANPFKDLNFFGSKRKRKKKEPAFFPLTKEEQALLRVDSVLFVTHLLGLEITLQMHDFFLALQQDKYDEAGSHLLAHSANACFGAIMAILARRIREANLDYEDMALQKAAFPQKQKRGRKAKSYFLRNFQPHSKFSQNKQTSNQQIHFFETGGHEMAGAVHGA